MFRSPQIVTLFNVNNIMNLHKNIVHRGTLVFRFKTIRVFNYVSSFYIKNRYILIYERYGIQLAAGRCAVQERIRKDVEEAAMVGRGISLRKGQPPARRNISGGKVPGS